MLVEYISGNYVIYCHHKCIIFMILFSAMLYFVCNFWLRNLSLVEMNPVLSALFIA